MDYLVPAEKMANVAKHLLVPMIQAYFVGAAGAVMQPDLERCSGYPIEPHSWCSPQDWLDFPLEYRLARQQ